MFKQPLLGLLIVMSLGVLSACSSTPYSPVAAQVPPVDVTAFAPKVESFVVLLDTSGSMKEVDDGRPKIQAAQDLVASFNSAVPAAGFQAGLVIFGRGAGTCWGYGAADTLYGLAPYDQADFASALGSVECAWRRYRRNPRFGGNPYRALIREREFLVLRHQVHRR